MSEHTATQRVSRRESAPAKVSRARTPHVTSPHQAGRRTALASREAFRPHRPSESDRTHAGSQSRTRHGPLPHSHSHNTRHDRNSSYRTGRQHTATGASPRPRHSAKIHSKIHSAVGHPLAARDAQRPSAPRLDLSISHPLVCTKDRVCALPFGHMSRNRGRFAPRQSEHPLAAPRRTSAPSPGSIAITLPPAPIEDTIRPPAPACPSARARQDPRTDCTLARGDERVPPRHAPARSSLFALWRRG